MERVEKFFLSFWFASMELILSNDLNDFMGYIQDNLMKQNEENKLMMSKIIQNK